MVYTGAAWEEIAPARLDNLEGLGIGTAADAVNRLAVASEAALFSHAGGDHRLVVNKAAQKMKHAQIGELVSLFGQTEAA